MGHAIETLNESRYDYLNPNVLYRIWEKENIRSYFTNVRSEFTIDEKALNIHRKIAFKNVPETYFAEHPEGVILNVHREDNHLLSSQHGFTDNKKMPDLSGR